MSANPDLSSDMEKILRSLERARTEAQNGWQDGKYGEFTENYLDGIDQELETLNNALKKLEEFIQSSEQEFPLS